MANPDLANGSDEQRGRKRCIFTLAVDGSYSLSKKFEVKGPDALPGGYYVDFSTPRLGFSEIIDNVELKQPVDVPAQLQQLIKLTQPDWVVENVVIDGWSIIDQDCHWVADEPPADTEG